MKPKTTQTRDLARLKGSSAASALMTVTTPVTFRTDDAKRERLDSIAEAKGRNRNWCINEALDNYLELYEWQAVHIKQGKAATDAGQTLSTDEVKSIMAEHHERRKARK